LNLTAKSDNKLLIHKNMNPVTELKNSIDIILTPQFYTFVQEALDLKFTYQAKQIAPSIFDDYLDNTNDYQYYVYKCDNLWCFLAYNINEIDKFLESVGIEKHRVSKIYFTQQLADQLTEPLFIDERSLLKTIDGVVTIVPRYLMDSTVEYQPFNSSSFSLKSGGVTMGSSLDSFISLKESLLLGTIFLILGAIFIVEGNRVKNSMNKQVIELENLLAKHSKYSTSFARESILSKYRPIDKKERAKRNAIKEISKLLSKKSHLKLLEINKNKVSASITTDNQTINKQVKEHAKAKLFKTSGSSLDVKVEKTL
jgi:hypothetical protein